VRIYSRVPRDLHDRQVAAADGIVVDEVVKNIEVDVECIVFETAVWKTSGCNNAHDNEIITCKTCNNAHDVEIASCRTCTNAHDQYN